MIVKKRKNFIYDNFISGLSYIKKSWKFFFIAVVLILLTFLIGYFGMWIAVVIVAAESSGSDPAPTALLFVLAATLRLPAWFLAIRPSILINHSLNFVPSGTRRPFIN